jgi:hypothetical protein
MMIERKNSASRVFLRLLLAVIIGFSLVLLAVNYSVDRYSVFHPRDGVFEDFLEPNTRVLKTEYLAANCSKFDAIVVGSSRAAAYHTADFNQVFGVNTYNFGVATGSLPGILERLEWLVSIGCMPRRIFLPLSIDRLRFPSRPNDLLRKEHPAIVGTSVYQREFLLSYLGTDAFFSNVRKLLEKLLEQPEPRLRYDMSSGDVDYLWDRELEFSACPEAPVYTDPVIIREFASYLARINSLADEHGAELTLLWNPIPRAAQLAHREDARRLFNDIGGVSSVIFRLPLADDRLIDGHQYHDKGHFKPGLAAAVFESADQQVSYAQLLEELQHAADRCR